MNYHDIKKVNMLNGDGLRVVLWVSGCNHYCKNCFNPETWDANSGLLFDENAMQEIREELSKGYCAGITFSGGDPLYPRNRKKIKEIIGEIKQDFPTKTIWLYTGYLFEELLTESEQDYYLKYILNNIDVLIDGKFIEEEKSINKPWVGSSNQRIINVQSSLNNKKIILI